MQAVRFFSICKRKIIYIPAFILFFFCLIAYLIFMSDFNNNKIKAIIPEQNILYKIKVQSSKPDLDKTLSVYKYLQKSLNSKDYSRVKTLKREETILNKPQNLEANHIKNNKSHSDIKINYLPSEQNERVQNKNTGFSISLAMIEKPEQSKEVWMELQKKYPKLLEHKYILKKIVQDEQIFYYLMVGRFKNFNDAYNLCRQSVFDNCIVVKN